MRAIVTGATEGGIGAAISKRLCTDAVARGDSVKKIAVCASSLHGGLQKTVDELTTLGAEVLPLAGNLADPDVPPRLIEEAARFCGGLDAVVANAGIYKVGVLSSLTLEDWELVFNVNARSAWLLAKAAYPFLRDSRGSMVVIGSNAAEFAIPGGGPYAASKAAVLMMARQLALEWAADGVRVNVVSPGPIRTPMNTMLKNPEFLANREAVIPMHRLGEPEDIAGVVAFLLGEDAGFVTGENLSADGGFARSGMSRLPPGKIYKV